MSNTFREYQLWRGRQRQIWLIPIADHRSQQQELAPALVLVGGYGQDARAIHGSSRSATVRPSAFMPNGPRLVVAATLGWRNRPLLSTRSDDDDDDDCGWTCGCAGKTVKSLENTCHTWALLRWWFTTKRRYIKCTHLYLYLYLLTYLRWTWN